MAKKSNFKKLIVTTLVKANVTCSHKPLESLSSRVQAQKSSSICDYKKNAESTAGLTHCL